jgi:microcystin-dependent protein
MVGFDASNTLFDTAEETGGSANAIAVSHTHTITDPGHFHSFTARQDASNTKYVAGGTADAGQTTENTASKTTGITINSAGSSGTNANYQPYITVYMWKRTA